MYPIYLPLEQLRRLWYLAHHYDLGPVRSQVVIAVEQYLEEKEKSLGTRSDPSGPEAPRPRVAR